MATAPASDRAGRGRDTNAVHVRCITRFRPDNQQEAKSGLGEDDTDRSIRFDFENNAVSVFPKKSPRPMVFTFDGVLGPQSTQSETFSLVAVPVIQDVLLGYNGTIFAYGQTGSGKTHTVFGPEDTSDPSLMGIIPRAVAYIIASIENASDVVEAEVTCSCLEIYQERLKDLLSPEGSGHLRIRQSRQGETYVEGLSSHYIRSQLDALRAIETAKNNRTKAFTEANASSSRSHSVIMLMVSQQMTDGTIRKGILNFGDLAGSERVGKTNASGQTLKEAQFINKSLTALGLVIHALSAKKPHVPFRDSALTQLLRDSLGGNSKTTMVICCSMHVFNREETIGTLRFGQRAKMIENKATINREMSKKELVKLVDQQKSLIKKLEAKIQHLKNNAIAATPPAAAEEAKVAPRIAELEEQRADLQTNIDQLQSQLDWAMEEMRGKDDEMIVWEEKVDTVTAEASDYKVKLMDAADKITDLENENAELKDNVTTLTQNKEEMSTKLRGALERSDELEFQHAENVARIQALEEQVQSLQTQNRELEDASNRFLQEIQGVDQGLESIQEDVMDDMPRGSLVVHEPGAFDIHLEADHQMPAQLSTTAGSDDELPPTPHSPEKSEESSQQPIAALLLNDHGPVRSSLSVNVEAKRARRTLRASIMNYSQVLTSSAVAHRKIESSASSARDKLAQLKNQYQETKRTLELTQKELDSANLLLFDKLEAEKSLQEELQQMRLANETLQQQLNDEKERISIQRSQLNSDFVNKQEEYLQQMVGYLTDHQLDQYSTKQLLKSMSQKGLLGSHSVHSSLDSTVSGTSLTHERLDSGASYSASSAGSFQQEFLKTLAGSTTTLSATPEAPDADAWSDELRSRFNDMDKDNDGLIDCDDFITLIRERKPDAEYSEEQLRKIFRKMDENGTGKLAFKDFEKLFRRFAMRNLAIKRLEPAGQRHMESVLFDERERFVLLGRHAKLKSLTVWNDDIVHGLKCTWLKKNGQQLEGDSHVGSDQEGLRAETFELDDNEHVQCLTVWIAHGIISGLTIETSASRWQEFGMSGSGAPHLLQAPAKHGINAFYGGFFDDGLHFIGAYASPFKTKKKKKKPTPVGPPGAEVMTRSASVPTTGANYRAPQQTTPTAGYTVPLSQDRLQGHYQAEVQSSNKLKKPGGMLSKFKIFGRR